ncbi:MAG TPA: ammonium transporter [Cytophagaceae bacterium]|jgi:Amt family ammonium transporter
MNLVESPDLLSASGIWIIVATALIFIMNLGFATLGAGLSRAKNATNILFKNTITLIFALLIFAVWGFSLMYPGEEFTGHFIGFFRGNMFFDSGTKLFDSNISWPFFLMQALVASVAATIVAGAVAERIKLSGYMIFSFFLIGFIYPVVGMWKWGGGWLHTLSTPFYDYAGASIVHSVGGWAALAGVMVLGPRIGKYIEGKIYPIPGHSMPLATIGVFLLWLGWIGFNGAADLSANGNVIARVIVITFIAGASGGIGAMLTTYFTTRTFDLTMLLSGVLGGLVAITAGADLMSPLEASIIGLISGLLVVFSILLFDKFKIDDPIGATSVHLVCGIFGTIAVGLFGNKAGNDQIKSQFIGVASIGIFVFILSYLVFFLINKIIGLRVTPKEEMDGLDLSEHGMKAYEIDSGEGDFR